MVQIVTPEPRQLPQECGAVTVPDRVNPDDLTPIQRVAVDAIGAELQRLQSAILAVGAVLVSIAEIEREVKFPFNVCAGIEAGELLQQLTDTQADFDERFAYVLRPWLRRSDAAEAVAARVQAEMLDS